MVKCKDCGLLTVYHPNSGRPREMTEQFRKTGTQFGPDHAPMPAQVFCSVGSQAFRKCQVKVADAAITAIDNEIDCPRWQKYIPGKTPKEHEQMAFLDHVRLEQAQFRSEEIARREKWREQDLSERGSTRIIAIAAAIAACLSAVGSLATYLSRP